MKIFDFVLSLFDRVMNRYNKRYHPQKFKIGDRVRADSYTKNFQDLVITKYDFYYDGYWWVYTKCMNTKIDVPFREFELELIFVETPYDPTQMGDKEDDI